jgi:hypothetical protein
MPGINPTRPLCAHCRRCVAGRPRGLCFRCYYTPGILRMYPPMEVAVNHRGVGGKAPLGIPEPTDALPGTEAKVAVLEDRARRGLCLGHKDDARRDCS